MNDLELARDLARIADEVAMRYFDTYIEMAWKPDGSPVTAADLACDAAIREELALHRPDDAVLAEESGATRGTSGRRWLIDPIDGTTYFIDGMSSWGAHVSLEEDGEITVAVLSRPALGRSWYGSKGGGAWRSDLAEPLRVSTTSSLGEARIGGYLYSRPDIMRRIDAGAWWVHDSSPTTSLLDGRLDAVVGAGGFAWDVAPAALLVPEAGGAFTDLAPGARTGVERSVSSNGLLHDAVLQLAFG